MLAAMQLTRFTDLGLRVLMYVSVSAPGEVVTIAEIGQRFDAAPNHLTKVVQFMGQQGWLVNVRGKGGGVRLARPAADYRLGQIVRALEIFGEGGSDADRENRIRQFEDFFNVSGMGTPDDLVEFREAQRGFQGRLERWSDISRGSHRWETGPTPNSESIGIQPAMTGTEFTHEGLYVNQHRNWQKFLLDGLDQQALKLREVE